MSWIFFLIIIAAAIIIIAVIILRKFPTVAALDLENLTEEQEQRKKREIIDKRLEARESLQKKLSPVKTVWEFFQNRFRKYVGRVEKLLHYEEILKARQKAKQTTLEEKNKEIADLMSLAEAKSAEGAYDKAEELFIAVIKIDKKFAPAYRGLADVYFVKGAIDEAAQTYDFLARLIPNDDALLVKLSELSEQKNQITEAINYLERAITVNDSLSPRFYRLAELYLKAGQTELAKEASEQAVELEPKNPKYLDFLVENAILCADRQTAEKAYEELRLVNPENQKLSELRAKIDKI